MTDPATTSDKNDSTNEEDKKRYEVLLAAYLFVAPGRQDYEAVMKLVEDKAVSVQGVVLVSKDHAGEMHIEEAGDHLVRHGAELIGGAGLVVGLFAPPLLAATAIGAGIGGLLAKFAKHRVESGIEEKLKETLPDGAATLIAIYDCKDADAVRAAVANSPKTSFADIDGKSVKELKAGLAEAQAGMAS
jgi:uncharacterized membrane protein